MRRLLFLAAVVSFLTGCAVGPNYLEPSVPAPAKGMFVATTPGVSAYREAEDDWWKLYDDPALNTLVQEALAANADIRVALANLEKVQAELNGVRGLQLPQTQVAGSATRQQFPVWQVLPNGPRDINSVDLGLNVSYEIDLFGRVRRSVEAANGDVGVASADLDAVRVTVAAETTRAYLDILAANKQIGTAEDVVRLLDRSIDITASRVTAGRAEQFDQLRLQSLRDQQASGIPPLQAQRDGALFRLAALLGRVPGELSATIASGKELPSLDKPIPVGDGAALLARRPDVRAAERRLAAATARVGVATADLYPRISLGGGIGTTSDTLGSAFSGSAYRYVVGPSIQWAFPNFTGVFAEIDASKADSRAALATFDGTVLTALKETETALSAYGKALDEQLLLARSEEEAHRAANIALERQNTGSVDFLTVLDTERSLATAKAELAAADARVASRQVDLFKALGGGWREAAALAEAKSDRTTQ